MELTSERPHSVYPLAVGTCPSGQQSYEDASFCPRDGHRLVGEIVLGSVVGERYRLVGKVGEGAMGEVYEAEHAHMRVCASLWVAPLIIVSLIEHPAWCSLAASMPVAVLVFVFAFAGSKWKLATSAGLQAAFVLAAVPSALARESPCSTGCGPSMSAWIVGSLIAAAITARYLATLPRPNECIASVTLAVLGPLPILMH